MSSTSPKEKITDNNKLIAEFMGLSHCSEGWILIPYHGREEVAEEEIVDELQYHTSWDWLMPVIEEIDGAFNHDKEMAVNHHTSYEPIESIEDGIATRSLEMTYKAVVEYIKKYVR